MRTFGELARKVSEEKSINYDTALAVINGAVDVLTANGFKIVEQSDYDALQREHYKQYKLRRAADEMFRAHMGLREYGPHVPAASSKQMVEWQAVLNGEDEQ